MLHVLHSRNRVALLPLAVPALLLVPHTSHAQSASMNANTASAIERAVDRVAQRAIQSGLGPGLGVAVVTHGRVVFARGYGLADASRRIPARDNTLWYVASTSKSYTGVATMLLATQMNFSLETSIASLLPAARWPIGVSPDSLTLADFLGHTHAIGNGPVVLQAAFAGAVPESEWPILLAASDVRASRALNYSNLGYNVAAMVIDARRPDGWRQYLQTALLAPAGLTETYSRVSGLDRSRFAMPHTEASGGRFETLDFPKADITMNGAGGHLATMNDLARWTLLNLDGGRLDGRQVLPEAVIRGAQQTLREHAADDPGRQFGLFGRDGWGAGWNIGTYEGAHMVSRFGSYMSTRSHLSFLPALGVGVVAQANGAPGGAVTDILAALVYDIAAGRSDAESRANTRLDAHAARVVQRRAEQTNQPNTTFAAVPGRYAGAFAHPSLGTFTIEQSGASLRFRWGVLAGPMTLTDAAGERLQFDMAGNNAPVRVELDERGVARAITLFGERAVRR